MEEFRFALKRYFLISLAYFFIGVTFGLLMKEAGYGTIWSFLSAIFIYGGTIQLLLVGILKNHTPNIYQPTKRRMLLKSSFRFALNTSINYLGDQINLASLRESQMQHSNLLDYKWQTLRTLKESYPLKPGTFLPLLSIKASCCTFCGHCVRICPTKALTVIRKDKRLLVWTPTKCENCNFCIEACPKHYLDFNLPLRTSILLEKTHYILWQEEPYQL